MLPFGIFNQYLNTKVKKTNLVKNSFENEVNGPPYLTILLLSEESYGYKQELVNGYETEIKYQRHMLENLGRWFSLLFIIASIGGIDLSLFHKSFPLWSRILLALVGI